MVEREHPWHYWIMIPLFAFLALGLAVIALSIQGSGYVLLVGSVVCAAQASGLWRDARRQDARPDG